MLIYMFDNYIDESNTYQSFHLVYTHEETNNHIYIGDISAALNLEFIKRQHISTVVTAAVGMDQVSYNNTVQHIVYPLYDTKTEDISRLFSQFYLLVEKQIKHGNILVHCAAGISRSATLVISYLIRKEFWTFKEAIEYIRKSRKNVCPNLGFERQLKVYQKSVKMNSPHYMREEKRTISKTSQSKKNMYQRRIMSKLPSFHQLDTQDENAKMQRRKHLQNVLENGYINVSFYQKLDKKNSQIKNSHQKDKDLASRERDAKVKFNIRSIKQSSSQLKRKDHISSQRNQRNHFETRNQIRKSIMNNRHLKEINTKLHILPQADRIKQIVSPINHFQVIKLNINQRKLKTENTQKSPPRYLFGHKY